MVDGSLTKTSFCINELYNENQTIQGNNSNASI